MFNGRPTHVATVMFACMQIVASMFFTVAIPAPQSLAHEAPLQLVANDLPAEPAAVGDAAQPCAGELEAAPVELAAEPAAELLAEPAECAPAA